MLERTILPFISRGYSSTVYNIGIIGGGAAGMAAALQARYSGYTVTVFESKNRKDKVDTSGIPLTHPIDRLIALGGHYFEETTIKEISKAPTHFLLRDNNDIQHPVSKILLAPGVSYQKLDIPGEAEMDGKGVYYRVVERAAKEAMEQRSPIIIYGSGNGAGQAALYYAALGVKVMLIYQEANLNLTMSSSLISKINGSKIEKMAYSELTNIVGKTALSCIDIKETRRNLEKRIWTGFLIQLNHPAPNPLPKIDFGAIALDARGYVRIKGLVRSHMSFATNIPNIFAAGDITSNDSGRPLLSYPQGIAACVEATKK